MTPTPDQREKALKYATRERDAFARQVRDCQSATHSEFKNALPMYQNRLEILKAIVAALTAPPQVPQEVVDALRDLRGCCNLPRENQYKRQCMVKADEALALLTRGKE